MVSVDDLVISLRIDDTSNLGKLQKQLTALVGPKGEKAGVLGIDPGFKRDIGEIKDRMIMLTHIAPGARKQPLIEQARAFFTQLRDPTMFQNVLDKMGYAKEDLEDIMVLLGDIGEDISPMKLSQISNYLKDVQTMITQSPDLIGDVKSLAARILKDVPEYIGQERLQKIFQELGHSVRESGMFISKLPADVRDVLKKNVVDWTEATAKKFEESGGSIEDLVKIITDIGDPIKAFEKAYPGVDLTKLVNITEKFEPYVAATIMTASNNQIAILKTIYEYIRDQLGQTKVIGRAYGRQQYDFIVRGWKEIREAFGGGLGLEHLGGKIKEMVDGAEAMEYEKILDPAAVKEFKERIQVLDHSILIVSRTNRNLPLYIQELEETAKLHKHTFEVWEANMRKMEQLVELAPTIDEIKKRLEAKIEEERKQKETNKMKEESKVTSEQKKADLEGMEEFLLTAEEGGRNIEGNISELTKKVEKGFLDSAKKLMGIDGKEEEILERIKKKTAEKLNEAKKEDNPMDDKGGG